MPRDWKERHQDFELRAMLSARNWRTEGESHESGIHCTGNTERDREIDWRSSSARTRGEEDDTGTALNINGWPKTHRPRPTGKVGENQGSEEIEKSPQLVRVPTPTFWKWAFFVGGRCIRVRCQCRIQF